MTKYEKNQIEDMGELLCNLATSAVSKGDLTIEDMPETFKEEVENRLCKMNLNFSQKLYQNHSLE